MRTIDFTRQFRRDYKCVMKERHATLLDAALAEVSALLVVDAALPDRYRDHALTSFWRGRRDRHLRPDLVLIYSKLEPDIVLMVRIGSHSELDLA